MSAVFESLVDDYNTVSSHISRQISALQVEKDYAKQKRIVDDLETELEDADQCIKSLDIEFVTLSTSQKETYRPRLNQCRTDLKTLRGDVSRAKGVSTRSALFADAKGRANVAATDGHARLLTTSERQDRNTERLRDARSDLVDLEDTGVEILDDLGRQRETMLHTRGNLGTLDSVLGSVRGTLRRMGTRQACMRLVWCLVILALLSMIFLIVYFKLLKDDSPSSDGGGANPAPTTLGGSDAATAGF